MNEDESAIALARVLPTGARVPWAELETRAFRGCPRVLKELGEVGRFQLLGERTRNPWFLVGLVLATLPMLILALLPVFALTALLGNDFGPVLTDSGFAIRTAGVLMVLAAVWLMLVLVRAAGGRYITDTEATGSIASLTGIGTLALIVVRGVAANVGDWPVWAGVSVITIVLGLLVTLASRRSRRVVADHPQPPAAYLTAGTAIRSRRDDAIAHLPAAKRSAVEAELREAIEILRRRGIVSTEAASLGIDCELGTLSDTMEPHSL